MVDENEDIYLLENGENLYEINENEIEEIKSNEVDSDFEPIEK